MSFLNPLAFLGFFSLAAIILMYMLKRKHEVKPFSSIMLWEKAALRVLAEKPWQKLRKNLLMFLQLLIASLIVFALAKPLITSEVESGNYILVLDAGYAMKTVEDGGKTRFELAQEAALMFLDRCGEDSRFSLVLADDNPQIIINNTDNKKQVRNAVLNSSASNSSAAQSPLENILKALQSNNEAQIVFFSDKEPELGGLQASYYSVGTPKSNLAITKMAHSVDADKVISMVTVHNYGEEQVENSVSLFVDGVLFDIKKFSAEAGSDVNVFFTNLPYSSKVLNAELTVNDALAPDDSFFDVVSYGKTQPVVLFTTGNVFLENALKLIPSIELYKGDNESINQAEGFYLYIYDGIEPEILPVDGHIMIFNPSGNGETYFDGEIHTEDFIINSRSFLNNIDNFEFNIYKSKYFETGVDYDVLLSSEGKVIAYSKSLESRKNIVFGFDLHETDLPLRKEFPIFIYNIIQWLVPEQVFMGDAIKIGDSVELNPYPDASLIRVSSPSGKVFAIEAGRIYSETQYPGIYTVEQVRDGRSFFDEFAVNLNISSESDIGKVGGNSAFEADVLLKKASVDISSFFLIIALILLAAEWFVLKNNKLKIPDGVRFVLLALIILSLFNINLSFKTEEKAVVFIADISDSMKNVKKDQVDFINEALAYKNENDYMGLVSFGKNSGVEIVPAKDISYMDIIGRADGEYTNISEALLSARSISPENFNKRFVILSDGNENLGDGVNIAKQLAEQNIEVDVLNFDTSNYADAQITNINLPSKIGKDMKYNIEVVAYSVGANEGLMNLYKNNALIASRDIEMANGENRYVFSDIANLGGNIILRAEITAKNDYLHQNNKAFAYSYVEDSPKILVVDDYGSALEIEKILDSSAAEYSSIKPGAFPLTAEGLGIYEAVILANINYEDLPSGFDELLKLYVKNGGGLLCVGGDNSYALGGYYETSLEEILPVNMELKSEEDLPSQAMVIVMDRSGSMTDGRYGVTKIAMAKEAIIRSIDNLHDEDYFGVVAFDTEPIWVAQIEKIGNNRQGVANKIASISDGGGTSIQPALREAYNKLSQIDAKIKHIVLLTDGQDGDRNYSALINQMKDSDITLSTVAVGAGSDTSLLESLAKQADGRYYYTDEFSDLPKIFSKEAFLSGKEYLNNVEFNAIVTANSEILESVNSLPVFYGYISSTAKPRADIILTAPEDEPLLAAWQYGVGRSVSFLTDMEGNWSRDFLLTNQGITLFRNMVSWVIRGDIGSEIYTKATPLGDKTKIVLNIPGKLGLQGVHVTLTTADLEEIDLELTLSAPGEYTGFIDNLPEGLYIANVALIEENEISYAVCGINIPYSDEYNLTQMKFGANLLSRIAKETGGNVLQSPAEVFRDMTNNLKKEISLKPWLTLLALAFLLFDIAFHRFAFLRKAINIRNSGFNVKKKAEKTELNLGEQPSVYNDGKNISKEEKNIDETHIDESKQKDSGGTSAKLISAKKKRSGR